MKIEVNVTPYTHGGMTKWDLDVVNDGSGKKGGKGGFGSYPTVGPDLGHTNELMVYTITNGGTWKFAADPLWVTTAGKDPSTPSSVPGQINPNTIHVANGTQLSFVDQNAGKNAVTLHYTLNFVNGTKTASTLDPIIQNGGCCAVSYGFNQQEFAIMAGALLVVLVLIYFGYRNFAAKRAGTGAGPGSTTGPDDISRNG